MNSDPEQNHHSTAQSQPPYRPVAETNFEKLAAELLATRERVSGFEEARWAMFTLKELRFIKLGLARVALDLATGHSIEDVIRVQELLESLHNYLDREYPGEAP